MDDVTPGRDVRSQIIEAALIACGRAGYAGLTVQKVCCEYGGSTLEFHHYFRDKSDCFTAAYAVGIERLLARVQAVSAGQGFDLARGLEELANFLEASPLEARALFVDVHLAPRPVRDKRGDVLRRAAKGLDAALRDEGGKLAPRITADFMVNALDHVATRAVLGGDTIEFRNNIPGLVKLVHMAYGPRS